MKKKIVVVEEKRRHIMEARSWRLATVVLLLSLLLSHFTGESFFSVDKTSVCERSRNRFNGRRVFV